MSKMWQDSYEFINGQLKPIEDGEVVRTSMLLMDSANAPVYLSDRKPGGCYCIDTATDAGRAWEERGARQREAWRTGGYVDELQNKREREQDKPPFVESGLFNTGIPSQAEAKRAAEAAQRAWEEKGRRQRDAWKNP